MSHHPHKEDKISCPNCGHNATKNYCAQCGQETHLHKETFIGLIIHFVGHYFHYDSKFWQTLKTLVTKPGKLTVAYWEKKRMRYIAPISLYIFVSAVFFLCFFATLNTKDPFRDALRLSVTDSIELAREQDSIRQIMPTVSADSAEILRVRARSREVFNSPEESQEIFDHVMRAFPKFFFFMIPVMAFVLKLLYWKRKDAYFVDHAIFSLHAHAFGVIIFFLMLYDVPDLNPNWLDNIMGFLHNLILPVVTIYLIIALHNAYRSGWIKSFFYCLIILASYIACFGIIFITYFVLAARQAIEGSA
jgi:DNA-directed RNA polymerase subunit RPC12/RpoP